jgi:alginate O-acetyltransferase complex protein AlgJ
MTRTNGHHKVLVFGFLIMISAVGIAQTVIEITRGDPVRVLDLFRDYPTADHLRAFEADLEAESWFEEVLRPPMQYARFLAFDDVGSTVLVGRDHWWFFRRSIRYLTEPLPSGRTSGKGYEAARSAIIHFRDELERLNIRLIVVPVPGKASIYPDKLTSRVDGPVNRSPTEQLIDDLREAGIDVVNLFEVFRRERTETDDRDLLYLPRDTHWTPEGMRLAVEAVADRIQQLEILYTGTTRYEVRPIPVPRRGDLVGMMDTWFIEQHYQPIMVRCPKVFELPGSQPYTSTNDSPILLLGDSFMRIYELDEPRSAGFAANLARELNLRLTSVIFDAGGATLLREALVRRPELLDGKKIVIWEFAERDIRFVPQGWEHVEIKPPAQTQSAEGE